MITAAEITEEIIRKSPFLEEGIARGLINLSQLAREMQPEIQNRLLKDIKTSAIIMALKRLSERLGSRQIKLTQKIQLKDITIRSNISEYTFTNSGSLLDCEKELLHLIENKKNLFLTFSQGIFETTIFASSQLESEIERIFRKEQLRFKFSGLSSLTISLPEILVYEPGVYYSILKILAWEGINFIDVVSSFTELTIFLEEKNVDRAFSALKKVN